VEASTARVARTVNLDETAHLHLTSRRGPRLNEEGTADGTIHGAIYIHVVQGSGDSATVDLNVYPPGSSLSGSGSATYRIAGGYAKFAGTVSITRGTGRYAHASAHGLRFTGAIQASTEAIDVRLSGALHY
jgi:hypothetical protein